jgi:oxaloacetate decarboxylase alpha subunit
VPRSIELIDTTLRDGNQSLWSATGITTRMILDVAPDLDRAGFRALDFITSTHMGTAVRWHHEDPWERIRLAAQAMPHTPLGFLTTGMRFISWERLADDVIALALRRLVEHGIQRVQVIDPMNDMAGALRSARLAKEAGAREVVLGLVYSLSPVHGPERYRELARLVAASGDLDAVYLKDPSGLLTPETTAALVDAVRPELGDLPLELHSHCNTGLAGRCYATAAERGVERLHTACPPLADGSSQPAARSTAQRLRDAGLEVRLDEEAVDRVSAYLTRVAEEHGLPAGVPGEPDPGHYEHQVPGGMISTLQRQLREIAMEDRLREALEEIPRVREELGWPIMVTPLSQFVGTQAVMNVVADERYARVSDQVIRYLLGDFGTPPGPVDPDVSDRILSRARARKLADAGPPHSVEDWRSKLGPDLTDEELLLRVALPAAQVDGAIGRRGRAGAPSS